MRREAARDLLGGGAMRSLLLVLFASGCTPITVAPPPAPARTMPDLPLPPDPPAAGFGRIVLDANGEPAKVARVTESPVPTRVTENGEPSPFGRIYLYKKSEPLCMAPCVVDLPEGAHELSFTSLADPSRTSTADVFVSSQPVVVRHAMGRDKKPTMGYAGGLLLAFIGGGLVTFGGVITGIGFATNGASSHDLAAENASARSTGREPVSPSSLIALGLVTLGVGLLTTGGGIALMSNDRPVHQDGATTYWPLRR